MSLARRVVAPLTVAALAVAVGSALVIFGPHWADLPHTAGAVPDWANADPEHALATVIGLAAWVCVLWLCFGVLLAAMAAIPGALGRAAGGVARRILPRAMRHALEIALGVTLVAGTAGPVFAATPTAAAPPGAPAATASAWPDLDRPTVQTAHAAIADAPTSPRVGPRAAPPTVPPAPRTASLHVIPASNLAPPAQSGAGAGSGSGTASSPPVWPNLDRPSQPPDAAPGGHGVPLVTVTPRPASPTATPSATPSAPAETAPPAPVGSPDPEPTTSAPRAWPNLDRPYDPAAHPAASPTASPAATGSPASTASPAPGSSVAPPATPPAATPAPTASRPPSATPAPTWPATSPPATTAPPATSPPASAPAPAASGIPTTPLTPRATPTPSRAVATPAPPPPNDPFTYGGNDPTMRDSGQEVVVMRGDTLWTIAARHLGPGATNEQIAREWPRWWAANRHVVGSEPDLILPGQRLTPPVSGS